MSTFTNKRTNNSLTMQSGLSLIELMIAMLISLLLIGGTIQIFISNKATYRLTEAQSRLQENARFAIMFLTRDIRMAGFIPCGRTTNMANTINSSSDWWLDFFNNGLNGYEGGASTFPADFPSVGTTAGDRVTTTDAIVALGGTSVSACVTSHSTSAASFSLCNPTSGIAQGDLLMVCDATNSSMFQMTTPAGTGPHSTIVHNSSSSSSLTPGNCTKGLGFPVDCTTTNGTPYEYGADAQIVKFQATAYFIGISQSGTTNSLYRRSLENTSGNIAPVSQEIVEGIENMQVLYGEDTDATPDGVANYYVSANNVTDMANVVSVRITLTASTNDNVTTSDQTHSITGATDKRLRQTFTTTIGIRNRLP